MYVHVCVDMYTCGYEQVGSMMRPIPPGADCTFVHQALVCEKVLSMQRVCVRTHVFAC